MSSLSGRNSGPTIRDVAAAAGVATSTVSRVFSRPDVLSARTVARVKAIAAEMGYSPDHAARALSTGRKDTVALLVPDIANPFFPPLIKGVERYFQGRGVSVLLAETDEDPTLEAAMALAFRGRADGVIIASPRSDPERLTALTGRVPLVIINRDLPGANRVLVDTATSIREAVVHLADLGHRSLAYLAGPQDSWSNAQRWASYQATTSELGLTAARVQSDRPDYESGRKSVGAVLETGATAVVSYDDILAQGLMAGLADRGVSVPGDISVVGCDDLLAPRTVPPMTSIMVSAALAGEAAARQMETLLAWLAEPAQDRDPLVDVIASSLQIRATTVPPATTRHI